MSVYIRFYSKIPIQTMYPYIRDLFLTRTSWLSISLYLSTCTVYTEWTISYVLDKKALQEIHLAKNQLLQLQALQHRQMAQIARRPQQPLMQPKINNKHLPVIMPTTALTPPLWAATRASSNPLLTVWLPSIEIWFPKWMMALLLPRESLPKPRLSKDWSN